MKTIKSFLLCFFVSAFAIFSANAQLTEHVYALDKDSVSDESFTASGFNIVSEK